MKSATEFKDACRHGEDCSCRCSSGWYCKNEPAKRALSQEEIRLAMAVDPFAGDDTRCRTLSDKIVTTRTQHECSHCGEMMAPGSQARRIVEVNAEVYRGKLENYYWCDKCLKAMAKMAKGNWEAYEELVVP